MKFTEHDRKIVHQLPTFADFQNYAKDDRLTDNQRLGFPEEYRAGKTGHIFADIKSKLTNLDKKNQKILDIGCGCGEIAQTLIDYSSQMGDELIMLDSAEMLDRLSGYKKTGWTRAAQRFPHNPDFLTKYHKYFDVIIIYSVIHHEFNSGDLWGFFDQACSLLTDGGQLLIGDIPNLSMRRRFFASNNGIKFHQDYVGRNELPEIPPIEINRGKIDDAIIFSLIMRARGQGLHGYIMPQNTNLPFSNRREDILITHP